MGGGTCTPARALALACVLACAAALPAAAQERPARVVSVNLCTDQLALLLAAPGQLVSVSPLAVDPGQSSLAEQASALHVNHGRAEEVFLLKPDLVLASSYTRPATLDMLRRLGIGVQVFAPAFGLDAIGDRLRQMGQALGRAAEGAAMADGFEADLAAARAEAAQGPRPRAAHYAANGYSAGMGTLAGEIVAAAGFDLIADELSFTAGGFVPLEVLAMAAPDMVVKSQRHDLASRAEEVLDHPVLARVTDGRPAPVTDRDWVCGTPLVLRAVARLAAERAE